MARKATKKAPVKNVENVVGNAAPVKAVEVKKEEVKEAAPVTVEEKAVKPVEEAKKAEEQPAEGPKRKGRKPGSKNKVKKEKAAVEKTENVFVESAGYQYKTEDVVANVRAAWVAGGHRAGTIKKLNVYINMDERKAYYVINEKVTGNISL